MSMACTQLGQYASHTLHMPSLRLAYVCKDNSISVHLRNARDMQGRACKPWYVSMHTLHKVHLLPKLLQLIRLPSAVCPVHVL